VPVGFVWSGLECTACQMRIHEKCAIQPHWVGYLSGSGAGAVTEHRKTCQPCKQSNASTGVNAGGTEVGNGVECCARQTEAVGGATTGTAPGAAAPAPAAGGGLGSSLFGGGNKALATTGGRLGSSLFGRNKAPTNPPTNPQLSTDVAVPMPLTDVAAAPTHVTAAPAALTFSQRMALELEAERVAIAGVQAAGSVEAFGGTPFGAAAKADAPAPAPQPDSNDPLSGLLFQ
jgi:hypothetical protein